MRYGDFLSSLSLASSYSQGISLFSLAHAYGRLRSCPGQPANACRAPQHYAIRSMRSLSMCPRSILGHSNSIISFWSHQLSQVHAGRRVVRTMWLWLIELRQAEEVLKSYHRCMLSKPRVQQQLVRLYYHHTQLMLELFKYTGSSTVLNVEWRTDVPQHS